MAGLYLRSGGAGDTTYLLLHGLGATGEVWEGLTDLMDRDKAGAGWRQFSRGAWALSLGTPYTYTSLMDDLIPLINEASRLVVVGHSMGGWSV
ncbi:MAG: hypothetical protein Ct9H300mP14_06170 [Gammaproteobacteria bacterium]|nr:MAG: hypothetical protein Ct9H300mP14_06170 [Gammaproteobacteria bacterium]